MIRCSVALTGLFAGLALTISGGCDSGPPRGIVTGTVTMDGKPLENALVTFVPEGEGENAVGKTDASGHYELYRRGEQGAQVGSYKVVVSTINQAPVADQPPAGMGSDSPEYQAYAQQAATRPAQSSTIPKEPIPARYNVETELTETVEDGTNEVNLELTSK